MVVVQIQFSMKLGSVAKLGSDAGPVIQANGRLTFEDDLRSAMLHFNERQRPH